VRWGYKKAHSESGPDNFSKRRNLLYQTDKQSFTLIHPLIYFDLISFHVATWSPTCSL